MNGIYKALSIKKAFLNSEKGFVELRGFEPRTSSLPAKRSSQLSYSPVSLRADKIDILSTNNTMNLFIVN